MTLVARGSRLRKRDRSSAIIGFTLTEVLVVMVIIGILTAIAAPSWLGFANNQRLNIAQRLAFSTLRLAQSNAKRTQTVFGTRSCDRKKYVIILTLLGEIRQAENSDCNQ